GVWSQPPPPVLYTARPCEQPARHADRVRPRFGVRRGIAAFDVFSFQPASENIQINPKRRYLAALQIRLLLTFFVRGGRPLRRNPSPPALAGWLGSLTAPGPLLAAGNFRLAVRRHAEEAADLLRV